jgi:hypothetical protein
MLTCGWAWQHISLNIYVFVEQPTTRIIVVTIAIGGAQAKGLGNTPTSSLSSWWLLFFYFVFNKMQSSRRRVRAMGRGALYLGDFHKQHPLEENCVFSTSVCN